MIRGAINFALAAIVIVVGFQMMSAAKRAMILVSDTHAAIQQRSCAERVLYMMDYVTVPMNANLNPLVNRSRAQTLTNAIVLNVAVNWDNVTARERIAAIVSDFLSEVLGDSGYEYMFQVKNVTRIGEETILSVSSTDVPPNFVPVPGPGISEESALTPGVSVAESTISGGGITLRFYLVLWRRT
jgi:hypothetical protein